MKALVQSSSFTSSMSSYRIVVGFITDYRTQDSDMRQWLCLFSGLSLLCSRDVEDAFAEDIMPDAPTDQRYIKFADYILTTYITSETRYPQFCGHQMISTYCTLLTRPSLIICILRHVFTSTHPNNFFLNRSCSKHAE